MAARCAPEPYAAPMTSGYLVMALQGGLGNQLFQYAAGLGIARARNVELRFDPWALPDDERWLPGLVGDDYREATVVQLARLGVVHTGRRGRDELVRTAGRRAAAITRSLRGRSAPHQPPVHPLELVGVFDEALLRVDLPVYLEGYFQTARWFTGVADHIARRVRLPAVAPLRPTTAPDGAPTVAVGFRRGDYVRLGWELPLSYYEHALARIVEQVPGAAFVVLGDDPVFTKFATDWVGSYGPAVSAYDRGADELVHLALAAACDHAVIANSSFAWWGAWFGDRRVQAEGRAAARVVLAPADYPARFGKDVLSEAWVTVPS